jgi:hypothetical protein
MGTTKQMTDSVFGEMNYNHSWEKYEEFTLLDKCYRINVIAVAYSDETITDEQRKGYVFFKENIGEISNKTDELIKKYIAANNITGSFKPVSLLIEQNGNTVILFDCSWDLDNGLAVKVYPEYELGTQDDYL